MVAEHQVVQERVEASKRGTVDVGSLFESSRMLGHMRGLIREQEAEWKASLARAAEAQELLQAAATARKAVEKLRDRRQSEHSHEEQRREQSFLDEVAILRTVRREPRVARG